CARAYLVYYGSSYGYFDVW
nr:immunoglobulin heavy chain junction region [Mus musculus]MBK4186661.1 immunoglobulin heavy chain junction region [Mus musculus]MBK4186662.1 immunoglobulin heavy chain junction region [Mus musculus]MBK4195272.1 immunoglobulin heavy chain junction region [Mus musculus]MBK4195831.1 immunoglobulin heavy chain junction region [Mus musculus]